MEEKTVVVEGASLEEALENASAALGVERRAITFKYDREHLAQGASTVKIIAGVLSPEAQARAAEEEARRAPPAPRAENRDRDRGRDRGRGGGRGRDDRRSRDRNDRGQRGRGRPERPAIQHDPARDEALRERGRQLAKRVLAGEGSQTVEDLNSYERHLIHEVVAELGGLVSQSAPGDERRKTVTISKKE